MTTAFIYWNINPEITNIFGISIRYYGLLFGTGLILSLFVLGKIFQQEQIPQRDLEKLALWGIIGILAGARLGHCLFYDPAYYFAHPIEMFLPVQFSSDGTMRFTGYRGLASHGGALGLIIVLILFSRKTKRPILHIIDLIAIAAPLAGGFIRLANLMNSEIIGIPTKKPWGFIFARVDAIPRHPTQLYEAFSYFFIFFVLATLYKIRRNQLKNGVFFGLSLALIFSARFIIEFFKERQVSFEEHMTFDMGQLLSIPYIVIGIGFVVYGLRKTRKQKRNR